MKLAPAVLAIGLMAVTHARRADAQARAAVDPIALKGDMHDYFAGEKGEGFFFCGAGVVALVAGGALLARGARFGKGMSYPLLSVGAVELVIGVALVVRTDRRVRDFDVKIAHDAVAFRADELARIHGVNVGFRIIEVAEATLLAAGIAAVVRGAKRKSDMWAGVGLGLAMQSAAMLTLDVFASERSHHYADDLGRLEVSVVGQHHVRDRDTV